MVRLISLCWTDYKDDPTQWDEICESLGVFEEGKTPEIITLKVINVDVESYV